MADTPLYRRPVWDPVVRILHWWMAITLLVQFALGGIILAENALGLSEAGEHGLITVHATFGSAFGAGLLVRILWLFLAPGTGSWRDLLPVTAEQRRTLRATAAHYLSGLRGEGPFYRAHNPLAGIAYVGFFLVGACQVTTGLSLFLLGEEKLGEAWEEVHGIGFWLIVVFVVAHLVMVAVHELTERRGFVSAMIGGSKLFTDEELRAHPELESEEGRHNPGPY